MIERCWILVAVLLLAGCVTRGVENVERLDEDHKILVISLMGDSINVRKRGDFTFGYKRSIELSDWDLDSRLENLASEKIRRIGRFQIAAPVNHEIRKNLGEPQLGYWVPKPLLKDGFGPLVDLANDFDANSVLLIAPTVVGGDIFLGGGGITAHKGYGTYQVSALPFYRKGKYFVTMQLLLIDGRSDEEFARTAEWDSSKMGESDWIEKKGPIPDAQQTRIKDGLWALFESVLSAALKELTLI